VYVYFGNDIWNPLSKTDGKVFAVYMQLLSVVTAGFGRAISEVGAVMMVGGNIRGKTRVMTTYIALETGKGNFEEAVFIGFVLLFISFIINITLYRIQRRE
jgi:tungstate transport system permease protein